MLKFRNSSVKHHKTGLSNVSLTSVAVELTALDDNKLDENSTQIIDFLSLDIEKSMNFSPNVVKIENFPSLESSLNFLTSNKNAERIYRDSKFLEIVVDEKISQVNETKVLEIFEKVQKSFIISFESKVDDSNFICWKFHDQIFTLDVLDSLDLASLLKQFLVNSLKSGESGLLPSFQFNPDSKVIKTFLESFGDSRNFNLLHLAAENGNLEASKFLLDCSFDVNCMKNSQIPADLANDNGHFDVLLLLLKANSKFPKNFNEGLIPDEVREFVELTKDLHDAIELNDELKVIKIIENHKNLRYFFNLSNKSALTVAILSKYFNIVELLISHNLYLGQHEIIEDIIDNLTSKQQKDLRDIQLKYTQDFTKSPIMNLMSHSTVGHDNLDVNEKLSHVLRAFNFLYQFPMLAIILKIVVASRNVKIIFDFKRESVSYIDPTAEPYTNGLFYLSGRIYIAAKHLLDPLKESEVFGTLAHELCHYAMFLVFGNFANPYREGDKELEKEFNEITRKCKEKISTEDLIDVVFEDYPAEMHPAELIVRPPHMIAAYHHDQPKIKKLREEFKELFGDFEGRCVDEMEKALPGIEEKANKEAGIEIRKIKGQNEVLKILITLLGLFFIIAGVGTYLFIRDPDLSWKDFSKSQKSLVFNTAVDFQGRNSSFSKIISENSSIYNDLTSNQLKSILLHKKFIIGENLNYNLPFYIERKFIKVSAYSFQTTFNKLAEIEWKEAFILSDEAGSGKSTTFKFLSKKIKKKWPDRWVVLIELKKYVEVYEEASKDIVNFNSTSSGISSFIASKILKLEKFERKVFMDLFLRNQVIILWDGFDEITPTYGGFITNIFKVLRMTTKNQQWVSSRPQHQSELEDILSDTAYSYVVYSDNDRREFVDKFLKFKNVSEEKIEQIQDQIETFIERIAQKSEINRQNLNNPLLLQMIAEVSIASDLSSNLTNFYLIYEKFLAKKFEVLRSKGDVVLDDVDKVSRISSVSILQVHQIYALKLIYGSAAKNLQIMKKKVKWTNEEISRFGILSVTTDEIFSFTHRTFAEFLVAQYYIDNIYEIDDEPKDEELKLRLKLLLDVKSWKIYSEIQSFVQNYLSRIEMRNFTEDYRKVIMANYASILRNITVEFFKLKNIKEVVEKEDSSVSYENHNKIDLLLTVIGDTSKLFKVDHEMLKILWGLSEKVESYNSWTFWKQGTTDFDDKIINLAKKYFNEEEIKELKKRIVKN